jgi:hypothetical protein
MVLQNYLQASGNVLDVAIRATKFIWQKEAQMEALEDDELALVISQFSQFHNNRINRRYGGLNQGCFGCGDPNHFVANCPRKNKHSFDKYDTGKRKDKREYTSNGTWYVWYFS